MSLHRNVCKKDGEMVNPATLEGQEELASYLRSLVGTPAPFEDDNFIEGSSGIVLEINNVLERNAISVSIINDGPGDFTVSFSTDGINWGQEITWKSGDSRDFYRLSVHSLRMTWISNSAYRVVAA